MNLLEIDKLKGKEWRLERCKDWRGKLLYYFAVYESTENKDIDVYLTASTASGIEKKIKTYLLTI